MDALNPQAIAALTALLDERLDFSSVVREQHAADASYHAPQLPQAVAYVQNVDEIAEIARVCTEFHLPIIPFGTGTAVEGGIVAASGGLCIDLSRLNRILRVSPTDMDATVEAGVTRIQLNNYLQSENTGLYFPVDPGADASLGGMAATCASGSAAVGYGTMRENVLGLKAVFADGSIVEVGGRARKSSAGYDLTRLLVGSEGTLALIAEVTLRLKKLPTAVSAAVCPFANIDSAVATAIGILSTGVPVARLELLDEVQMQACNQYSALDYPVAPTLFFEFHGSKNAVVEQAENAEDIVREHGGGPFRWATETGARDRLWQARYDAYHASRALRPGSAGYVTDVCVPISALADCIRKTKEALADLTFPAPLFGHVGDGNFHVVCLIEPGNDDELAQVRQLGQYIIELALAAGGTCTGEHGIGLGKIAALEAECGAGIDIMRRIKQALDPNQIMNPGKVLRR
ncbi:MAG: FAD-binding protein [Gemmatimonadetes bacterium]|nr:FAD-binding protein [Gemmatimonadota bacterium]